MASFLDAFFRALPEPKRRFRRNPHKVWRFVRLPTNLCYQTYGILLSEVKDSEELGGDTPPCLIKKRKNQPKRPHRGWRGFTTPARAAEKSDFAKRTHRARTTKVLFWRHNQFTHKLTTPPRFGIPSNIERQTRGTLPQVSRFCVDMVLGFPSSRTASSS